MSICRFWWDGSDVYMYESDRGIEIARGDFEGDCAILSAEGRAPEGAPVEAAKGEPG